MRASTLLPRNSLRAAIMPGRKLVAGALEPVAAGTSLGGAANGNITGGIAGRATVRSGVVDGAAISERVLVGCPPMELGVVGCRPADEISTVGGNIGAVTGIACVGRGAVSIVCCPSGWANGVVSSVRSLVDNRAAIAPAVVAVVSGSGAASAAVCVPTRLDRKRVMRSVVVVAAAGRLGDRPGLGSADDTAGLHVAVAAGSVSAGTNDGIVVVVVTPGAAVTTDGAATGVLDGDALDSSALGTCTLDGGALDGGTLGGGILDGSELAGGTLRAGVAATVGRAPGVIPLGDAAPPGASPDRGASLASSRAGAVVDTASGVMTGAVTRCDPSPPSPVTDCETKTCPVSARVTDSAAGASARSCESTQAVCPSARASGDRGAASDGRDAARSTCGGATGTIPNASAARTSPATAAAAIASTPPLEEAAASLRGCATVGASDSTFATGGTSIFAGRLSLFVSAGRASIFAGAFVSAWLATGASSDGSSANVRATSAALSVIAFSSVDGVGRGAAVTAVRGIAVPRDALLDTGRENVGRNPLMPSQVGSIPRVGSGSWYHGSATVIVPPNVAPSIGDGSAAKALPPPVHVPMMRSANDSARDATERTGAATREATCIAVRSQLITVAGTYAASDAPPPNELAPPPAEDVDASLMT
jgi:hypothetical protein